MADKKGSGTGALYLADLGYPMLPAGATEQEKFNELQDYLFRLVEALRWTMGHLDETNFNQNFFLDFAVGERYDMLPMEWTADKSGIKTYDVDAGNIGTLDGEIYDIELALTGFSIVFYGHYPTTETTEDASGHIGATLSMTDVEITKQTQNGSI